MKNSDYIDLCLKYISGNISGNEEKKIEAWISSSSENRKLYNQLSSIWEQMNIPEAPEKVDIESEWYKIQESLKLKISPLKDKNRIYDLRQIVNYFKNMISIKRYKPAIISFACIIFILLSILLYKIFFIVPDFEHHYTLNGEKKDIRLNDNSQIYLNSASSLKVSSFSLDSVRKVYLKGEAFFKVTKDKKPFIVLTENTNTTVIGTEFNIRSRDKKTRVIVKEGTISFSIINDSSGVILQSGQFSEIINKNPPTPPTYCNTDYLLGWLNNKLNFERTPLEEIAAELERVFNVSIEIKSKQLAKRTITASFDISSIKEILSSICLTLNAQYHFYANKYIIE